MRSSFTNRQYNTLFELIDAINEHVEAEKYAIIKMRTKTSKKEVVRNAFSNAIEKMTQRMIMQQTSVLIFLD